MNKSSEFENGVDPVINGRHDSLVFDSIANEHFRYSDAESLISDEDGRVALRNMLTAFFDVQQHRLKVLSSYARGGNYSILTGSRRLDKEKADYRVRHKWGGYISSFATSYVIGNPVTISVMEKADKAQLEAIKVIEWENDINSLNVDLAFDASVFGRAFEYHFRDKDNRDRVVLISPLEMFVIRDLTVEQNVIAAVHVPVFSDKVSMTLYTKDKVVTFKEFAKANPTISVEAETMHSYNDVPVVEWWNNRYRMGDYESEISLIDAYDAGQSDTANYMSDLNDAVLVISGDLDAVGLDAETVWKMKKANILLLKSGIDVNGKQTSVGAGYIYKQYDVQGAEAYKNRIANDIHRFSRIPNLEDDRFNTTSSGIALLYKMIGLDQVRKEKESYFTKALRRRYELISNIHKAVNGSVIDPSSLIFTFHPNIPQDIWTEIKAFVEAGGDISQETLADNATFTDFAKEKDRLMRQSGSFDGQFGQNVGDTDDEHEGS